MNDRVALSWVDAPGKDFPMASGRRTSELFTAVIRILASAV
jgi:hypothetical protein